DHHNRRAVSSAVVVDAAAVGRNGRRVVAADSAVAHCHGRVGVVEAATVGGDAGGRVAADGAFDHGHRRAVGFTHVVDAAAAVGGGVGADSAIAHRGARVLTVDAAAIVVGGRTVGDGQAGDGDDQVRVDVKHAAGRVAAHRQRAGAGAED